MAKYILVAIGGGAGSLARYIAGTLIMSRAGGRFPMGTFIVNVTGCFAVGVIMTLLTDRLAAHPNWRYLLVIGFLGGYTTFSSFEYESFRAFREGSMTAAALNIAGSVAAGFAAVWLGVLLAARR